MTEEKEIRELPERGAPIVEWYLKVCDCDDPERLNLTYKQAEAITHDAEPELTQEEYFTKMYDHYMEAINHIGSGKLWTLCDGGDGKEETYDRRIRKALEKVSKIRYGETDRIKNY